jgi:hypothetical protein
MRRQECDGKYISWNGTVNYMREDPDSDSPTKDTEKSHDRYSVMMYVMSESGQILRGVHVQAPLGDLVAE